MTTILCGVFTISVLVLIFPAIILCTGLAIAIVDRVYAFLSYLLMPAQKPVKGQIGCDACGRYHGCVTEQIRCLSDELARKRLDHRQHQEKLAKALETIERMKKLIQ